MTTLLFQLDAKVVPNWFGVAIPSKISDFTKPNIFFHPSPGQAGYKDADYQAKTGKWPQLFYYMERLGYQVDAAIQLGAPSNQIVIMPFLTTALGKWILPASWFDILTDILTDVRSAMGGGTNPVQISEVVLSSFSAGLGYSNAFRLTAKALKPLLKQVWDFDGFPKPVDVTLKSTAEYKVIKYDQHNEPASFHVPIARWGDYPNPPPNPGDRKAPKSGLDVHQLIADYMFLHAATMR